MKNKYIICFLLIIDLCFFLFCYGYAVMNPVIMDGTVNLMTSIVGNNLLYPMIISGIIFVCGVILYIFLWEDDYIMDFILIIDVLFFMIHIIYVITNPIILNGQNTILTSVIGHNVQYPLVISILLFVGLIIYKII